MSLGQRVFTLLLKLLPGEFRGDFGEAMLTDAAQASRRGSFWWLEIGGLLGAIVREHADILRQDLKYALRAMARTPAFTLTAVAMLAVGTGANVAMFSIIDAVMIRSPFRDGDRIVRVLRTVDGERTSGFSLDEYHELAESPAFSSVAAFGGGNHVMTSPGDPRAAQFECVSASMFDVLGTAPLLGSVFTASDDRPGSEPKAVLEYKFWQSLGGSPAIIGSSLTVNGRAVTVAGVMPLGYTGALSRLRVDGWLPLFNGASASGRGGCVARGTINVFARLAPGATVASAASAFPGVSLLGLEKATLEDWQTPFSILSVAVVCILLIACANVGGLQLERTLARRQELDLRRAIGASRGRLFRQVLTENLVLAFTGAIAGVLVTASVLKLIVSLMPANIPHLKEIAVDGRTLAAAIAIASCAGILAGLAPLLQLRRATAVLGVNAWRSTSRSSNWPRRALVAGQIALSTTVLIGAGLMVRTFATLRPDQPGFDVSRKITTLVRLPGRSPAEVAQANADLRARLLEVPGVTGTAPAAHLQMSGSVWMEPATISSQKVNTFVFHVSPEYMRLLHLKVVHGRALDANDGAVGQPVIVINDLLARRIREDGDVVGMTLAMDGAGPTFPATTRRIVGVVSNMRTFGSDLRPRPEVFAPFDPEATNNAWLIVETRDDEAESAARAAMAANIRRLGADVVIEPIARMADQLDDLVDGQRFGAWLLGTFAVMAVGLAAVGLTTTLGWWVRQRTREIGIRMALGASAWRVAGDLSRQGLLIAAAGLSLGLIAAVGLTRYMASWIYGVTPLDPATFAGCAALMLGVAVIALFFPTRRASRVDPVIALQAE